MSKEIYTPMERILIEGAQKLSTKEVCAEAAATKEQMTKLEALDLMLLEMEAKADMMDGLTMEEWLL